MREFIKLDKYGQIYIDKVLFESYFPVVFTCLNDKKDVFIGVCCQNNEKGCKWLLGKTNGISLVRMLRDEITIRQLLLEYSSGKISVDYAENKYTISYNNSDWDESSPYLPKEDSYMYAEDGEFDDEINYFSLIDNDVHYNTKYYKSIAKESGIIDEGIELSADALDVFASTLGNISIPSEIVVSTLKVSWELCTNIVIDTGKYIDQKKYKLVHNSAFKILSEDLRIKVESDDNNFADAA